MRITQLAGEAFRFGIQRHLIDGVPVQIYSPAKTVADCFRFRTKIGLDVALEALREGLRARKLTRDELWAAAEVCRVTEVLRPLSRIVLGATSACPSPEFATSLHPCIRN